MSFLDVDIVLSKHGFTLDIGCILNDPVTGIFGPSGAGKTTLLRLISGLETPEKGRITIQEHEVFNSEKNINVAPEKRKVGYVFQEGRLFPHLNVAQNLKYGMQGAFDKELFEEVADLLKISHHLHKKISQISGGQAQRVAIGRALLSSPDILVLDEPFSSLDKNLRQHIILLLKPLINRFKIPMLVVSHDLSDLLMLSHQLLILREGSCTGYGNYFDLIGEKDAISEMSKSGLVNSIEMKLDHIDEKKGIIVLSINGQLLSAELGMEESEIADKEYVNVFLRPEDVTLALHKIQDISIQNQMEGTIRKIIIADGKVLCVIDHGFKLITEVTLVTKEKMNLKVGQKIWSLFKAAAIKINYPSIVN